MLLLLLFVLVVPLLVSDRSIPRNAQRPQGDAVSPNSDSGSEQGTVSAEIVSSRLVSFKSNATKLPLQRVKTTWKNTGTLPIRVIEARFTFRDERKQVINTTDYTLYAASSSDAGVPPGRTYSTPKDEGFVFINPTVRADSVEVTILSASDKGM